MTQPYSAEETADALEWLRHKASCYEEDAKGAVIPAARLGYSYDARQFERLAATLAELEGLRQDKERLDWLERNASEGREPGVRQIAHWLAPSDTLRAYIDRHPFGWGDAARSLPGAPEGQG